MDIILLAISISLDSLGIGASYGIKKIKIKPFSILIIVGISIAFLIGSFFVGQLCLVFISANIMKKVGSILLILFGSYLLSQAIWHKQFSNLTNPIILKKWKIKSLNIIVNIIQEPIFCDMDQSGSIDGREALYIGIALALDTIVVGLSASVYEIHLGWFILALAFINTVFLKLGSYLGEKSSVFFSEQTLKIISSIIILALGVIKMW
ncbi:MAG: hypothetical protein GX347_08520 [Epulopiscium sp.]|nr:hypothetical protein [Candidatus Epulonipiscium sp.]